MEVFDWKFAGVRSFTPRVFRDDRGWFFESYRQSEIDRAGLPAFVQHNQSRSARGVVRGLHYQLRRPQAKLVRAVRGEVFDVVVDIRVGSPSFGRHLVVELSEDRPEWLYIPANLAHGFCALTDVADVEYRCSEYYEPDDQRGVLWSDPALGISWPTSSPTISPRDREYLPLSAERDDLPRYVG